MERDAGRDLASPKPRLPCARPKGYSQTRARGGTAFRLAPGQPAERMDSFAPEAEHIVIVPRVSGGNGRLSNGHRLGAPDCRGHGLPGMVGLGALAGRQVALAGQRV